MAQIASHIAINHHTDWLKYIGANDSELKCLTSIITRSIITLLPKNNLIDYILLVKSGAGNPYWVLKHIIYMHKPLKII